MPTIIWWKEVNCHQLSYTPGGSLGVVLSGDVDHLVTS